MMNKEMFPSPCGDKLQLGKKPEELVPVLFPSPCGDKL